MIYISILIATIAAAIIGPLWYSPLLFGTIWMRLSGIIPQNPNEPKDRMVKQYGIQILFTLVMATALCYFVEALSITSVLDGLALSFWLWLGFQTPILINNVLWDRKPLMLFLIHAGYYILAMCVTTTILILI